MRVRFIQHHTWRELYELYRLTCPPGNIEPRHGSAARGQPRSPIDAAGPDPLVVEEEVPSIFNARAETIAAQPMFRAARGQLHVPASSAM
jgi:putative SOS response-associated peptidase YedK